MSEDGTKYDMSALPPKFADGWRAPKFVVARECGETKPCQHAVYFRETGHEQLMYQPDITRLFWAAKTVRPDHFGSASDESDEDVSDASVSMLHRCGLALGAALTKVCCTAAEDDDSLFAEF